MHVKMILIDELPSKNYIKFTSKYDVEFTSQNNAEFASKNDAHFMTKLMSFWCGSKLIT